MPAPSAPAAVLWDMDGTLVDTEPTWFEAETVLVQRFGGTWSHEQALSLVGSGLRDGAAVLRAHGVAMPVDEIVAWQTAYVTDRLREHLPWRPGALELLRALRDAGTPTALVTMSVRSMAEAVADAVPFRGFDVIVSGSDVSRPKPDPEPYLRAAELLGITASACVAIEDSPPGLASAVGSGAATIGVPHMVPLPSDPRWRLWPTLEGRRPADLADVAAAIGASTA